MTDEKQLTAGSQKPSAGLAAPHSIEAGRQVGALIPRNIEETFRLAEGLVMGGGAPRGMNQMEAFTVIAKGLELGFGPLQALSTIANINGRLSIYGDGLIAIARRGGNSINEKIEGNGDARTATCTVTRSDTGETITRTFSVSDARTARLWGKSGPWSQYPDRMLAARARSYAIRDGLSDQLFGIHVAEEAEDIPERKTPAVEPKSANRLRARLGTNDEVKDSVKAEPVLIDECISPNEWLNFLSQNSDPSKIVSEWTKTQKSNEFVELSEAKRKALSSATNARVEEIEQELVA